MSIEFDSQQYLTRLGHALLADGGSDSAHAVACLTEAAGALVAAGLLVGDLAQSVLDDCEAATTGNRGSFSPGRMRAMRARIRDSPRQVLPVRARRIARCDHVIERDQGTLRIRQIHLARDETSAVVHFVPRPGWPLLRDQHGQTRLEPVQITIADDRGTETIGWCAEGSRAAPMSMQAALAVDTAWLEFDGERCDLIDEQLAETSIGAATADDRHPGLAYLWCRVALHSDYGSPHRGWRSGVDALKAANVITNAEADDIQAVRELLDGGQPEPQTPEAYPEPWRSMLSRRGRDDGQPATILVNATIPPTEGISIAVRRIESRASGFTIAVEVTPSLGSLTPYTWQQGERVAWLATDDRGNHYLGQTRQWVSHDHGAAGDDSHGTITFWPALDPNATRLDVIPTIEATKTVLCITLTQDPSDLH